MSHLIQFTIPKGTPREEVVYAAMTCMGMVAVLRISDGTPAAIIKNYMIQDDELLFILDVLDADLLDNWNNTEDDSFLSNYHFIDPVSCNWGLIN